MPAVHYPFPHVLSKSSAYVKLNGLCVISGAALHISGTNPGHVSILLDSLLFRNNTAWTPTAGLPTTGAAVHVRNVNSVRMQNVWVMIYLFHIYMLCDCFTVIVSLAAVYSHIYHMT